jgi:hypothetical protein
MLVYMLIYYVSVFIILDIMHMFLVLFMLTLVYMFALKRALFIASIYTITLNILPNLLRGSLLISFRY